MTALPEDFGDRRDPLLCRGDGAPVPRDGGTQLLNLVLELADLRLEGLFRLVESVFLLLVGTLGGVTLGFEGVFGRRPLLIGALEHFQHLAFGRSALRLLVTRLSLLACAFGLVVCRF